MAKNVSQSTSVVYLIPFNKYTREKLYINTKLKHAHLYSMPVVAPSTHFYCIFYSKLLIDNRRTRTTIVLDAFSIRSFIIIFIKLFLISYIFFLLFALSEKKVTLMSNNFCKSTHKLHINNIYF